ncbi:hypothetical protein H1D32_08310 [Anaerobacillus sp. CMMVII]|uniref:hypothetical protein n=1 Tax=Anaerobacillus sp. CMMVII TaxID=2755588 RepID=UPI0021B74651|nr:hypothetical protein [Anaerobacillus sp. CMMVII]MCT8137740.1 hypothetical protein [Anaerobacillus sp. CMMVII]MCT8137761.1 hypothetical protein [Anaerobacillus sp. CMMVII]
MKNRDRMISVLFFIFLLILPLQVFAHGDEDDDGHDVDSAPWLSEKRAMVMMTKMIMVMVMVMMDMIMNMKKQEQTWLCLELLRQ